MNILENIYSKSVTENERNLRFWEDYLNNLKSLDFNKFAEKLTVPILVPIGSRILFRGELKHTNEITVAMGADYFAKCSIAQAEILRQHRIKDAQAKVDMYRKEKDYLENQLIFRKQNILDSVGQEIVEEYTEEQDKEWRKKHRENVRQYKTQNKSKVDNNEEITDEELWNRLEELELQEELENELLSVNKEEEISKNDKTQSTFIIKGEEVINPVKTEIQESKAEVEKVKENKPVVSKLDLLQKVIDRQNELEERLQELKHKERSRSKTENDLISRLDEMEQLDELEDEMDRLDDIIEGEDVDSDDGEITKSPAQLIKRSVSFADEDESETLEITFKHSDIPPSTEPYDSNKGIQKPSDIYSAYENLFSSETTSILKKSKYSDDDDEEMSTSKIEKPPKVTFMQTDEDEDTQSVNKTIVVGDIVERTDPNGNMVEISEARPTSLFKKKRMQKKN
ncbi:hypothetical protein ABMA27_007100 [Loxostege sticticalis]|uniref:Unconventional prefoldin RPB5 interactor n=1 Tax=Loxostege sticticalis TaxID=481309 RepID=A0ABR3ILL1_LOXSC